MYTWEIEKMLNESNYYLTNEQYLHMCWTSSQIMEIRYNPFSDDYDMWVDGQHYGFKVHNYKE